MLTIIMERNRFNNNHLSHYISNDTSWLTLNSLQSICIPSAHSIYVCIAINLLQLRTIFFLQFMLASPRLFNDIFNTRHVII